MRLRVIDLETTGTPPEADVVEAACVDVVGTPRANSLPNHAWDWRVETPGWSTLVRPTRPIEVEARAVHHLSESDVAKGEPWGWVRSRLLALVGDQGIGSSAPIPDYIAAHNCSFEQAFLNSTEYPWICTYKAALRLWPEAPKHSNSVLRYYLDGCDPGEAGLPPHRALPDCRVTALILLRCLERASVEELVRWTEEPRLLTTIPFGKHAGVRWENAPRDYLQWVLRSDFEEDVKWNARRGLHDPRIVV